MDAPANHIQQAQRQHTSDVRCCLRSDSNTPAIQTSMPALKSSVHQLNIPTSLIQPLIGHVVLFNKIRKIRSSKLSCMISTSAYRRPGKSVDEQQNCRITLNSIQSLSTIINALRTIMTMRIVIKTQIAFLFNKMSKRGIFIS